MRSSLCASVAVLVLTAALASSGCGGGNNPEFTNRPPPPPSAFPEAAGRTLADLLAEAPRDPEVVLSPTQTVFEPGLNRFGLGVYDLGGKPLPAEELALYVAPSGGGSASGPYPARVESLQTEPAFRSQTVGLDPNAAPNVYVSEVRFSHRGDWDIIALIRHGDDLRSARLPSRVVGDGGRIPSEGEVAPRVHTPTQSDVRALSEIDTRVPPSTMHGEDLYDVLGTEPVVLLFATPALCQARVCGPVVDEAEQVKATDSHEAAFIHMEIWEDNIVAKGVREQVRAFGLTTEPWLFVIDAEGRVSTRIEGAFGISELEAALAKTAGSGGDG